MPPFVPTGCHPGFLFGSRHLFSTTFAAFHMESKLAVSEGPRCKYGLPGSVLGLK